MCISVTYPEWPSVVALAERYANIYATAGVHPDYEDIEEPRLPACLNARGIRKVQAIGETGLDYYRLQGDLEWQRERFRTISVPPGMWQTAGHSHPQRTSDDTLRLMREKGRKRLVA